MDHRCLYGHRVPASFTFAIQSRNCPTCGAPTVTLIGYQAARKLASEGVIEAVAAFHAVRLLESEWSLTPVATEPSASTAPGVALGAADAAAADAPAASDAPPTEEEEMVVEDVTEAPAPAAAPEPRIAPRVKVEERKARERSEPRVDAKPSGGAEAASGPGVVASTGSGFGSEEEDFFKGA